MEPKTGKKEQRIKIGNTLVGDGCKPFVIAEIGINHQGDVEIAKQMIDAAKLCGADAVKFQKREITAILTKEALDKPYCGYASFGNTYGEHRQKLELSRENYWDLKKHCEDRKIILLASAWDETSADFLEELGVPAFKIASADVTNIPLLMHIAKIAYHASKPVILSTGMSNLDEVDRAVDIFKDNELIIMQCTSTYPCEVRDINLNAMLMMRERYGKLVGLSSHEWSIVIPVVATVLGACMIEKHFTLNKTWKGSDHAGSLEPYPFQKMVRDIGEAARAMGSPDKRLLEVEVPIRNKLAKSIVTTRHIQKGESIGWDMMTTKSPGTGIPPARMTDIVGMVAVKDIEEDTLLNYADLE